MKPCDAALYVKGYDLLLWLVDWTEKLPRAARRLHGDEVVAAARAHVLAVTLALSFVEGRFDRITEADAALARLRLALRLAGDRKVLSDRHRHYLLPLLDEQGRMLGGWRRSERVEMKRFREAGAGPELGEANAAPPG